MGLFRVRRFERFGRLLDARSESRTVLAHAGRRAVEGLANAPQRRHDILKFGPRGMLQPCLKVADHLSHRISGLRPEVAGEALDGGHDRLDGLRLDWPGKWLLVRASNTEPIVRAVAEAPTAAEAARLCAEAQAAMNEV